MVGCVATGQEPAGWRVRTKPYRVGLTDELQTRADSPESVPFYERIGYRPRAIIDRKEP